MSRAYAGVLGFLAFGVSVARGVADGQDAAAVLPNACLALLLFAAAGAAAGVMGDSLVKESVEKNLQLEIEAFRREAANQDRTRRKE